MDSNKEDNGQSYANTPKQNQLLYKSNPPTPQKIKKKIKGMFDYMN